MSSNEADKSAWKRVIGIVGGLGPYAHIELERLILDVTRRRFKRSLQDQDFPEWIVSSIPSTPDRTLAILGEVASPLPFLERSVRRLCGTRSVSGADFAVVACNTAHACLEDLRSRVELPILDMVGETVHAAAQKLGPGEKIGILATTGTLRSQIYTSAAKAADSQLTLISLLDVHGRGRTGESLQDELVMQPIYGELVNGERSGGIKSGITSDAEREAARRPLCRAVEILAEEGARIVLTACTEIPLALGRDSVGTVALLDPLEVAAEACVSIALGERPLPE